MKYILESRGIYKTEDEINNILKTIKNENKTVDDEYLLQVVKNE